MNDDRYPMNNKNDTKYRHGSDNLYDSDHLYHPGPLPDLPEEAMLYRFRQGLPQEAEAIWSILLDGRRYLSEQGIDQWQKIFPLLSDVQRDIALGHNYVQTVRYYDHVEKRTKEEIVGTLVLFFQEDPTYSTLREGKWMQDGPYGTMHRVAIRSEHRGKKLAHKLFYEAYRLCLRQNIHYIRVDTHEGNKPMRSLIEQQGFHYCGKITVSGGEERLAYEKNLLHERPREA